MAAERAGREVTDEGFNDWKSTIGVAGKTFEKHPDGNISAADVRAAVEAAREQWHANYWKKDVATVRQEMPLLSSDAEARKIIRSAELRTWLVSKVPETWQARLGLSSARTYNEALNRGYQNLIDSKADGLLAQRASALKEFERRGPQDASASLAITAVSRCRGSNAHGRRVAPFTSAAGRRLQAARSVGISENVQQNVQQPATQNTPRPAAQPNLQRGPEQSTVQQQNVAPAAPQARVTQQVAAETPQERALSEIRRIQLATPVSYQDKATEAMSKRLQNQLLQGASSVDLSASYRGDPSQAVEAHRRAIEGNMDVIEATRRSGVPVNVGQANVVTAKKKGSSEKIVGRFGLGQLSK